MSPVSEGVVPLFGERPNPEVAPTVAGLMLGRRLRELRSERTLGVVAKAINASVSKISRLERGESPPDFRDIRELAAFFGLDTDERWRLMGLAQRAVEPEWFEGKFSDCAPQWMKRLIGIEAQCALLLTFEAFIVPGLIQTPRYAQQIIHDGLEVAARTPDVIELRAELRAERQDRFFHQALQPHATFLLDESILYRMVGDETVMYEQIQKLIDLMDDPRVCIRVVPLSGKVVSNHASMTHLSFDVGELPPMVYVEGNDNADYHSQTRDVERFATLLLRLSNNSALNPKETLELLQNVQKRYV
ncbi:helix-turn-helix transcriptional regulator [Streptomyces sp. LP11]|uniref:Helix-turn-helix transcriptional regulator n=1 Tax=Streptomyces pyxinicus TaxID=2970331 RepID=A0ABT2B8W9_9ACTN|nr:helix-turn-helix transcriptional regulator [Streptomyces sp. LP11]MCS0604957.1 helix-turn-helix transcriptional regulator [Streptomyces sp. LP11]